MTEQLPTIKQMYSTLKQKSDFNVTRAYQSTSKKPSMHTKPSQRGHYLDQHLKSSCSPGPADKANRQYIWFDKDDSKNRQVKRSNRYTEVDQITIKAKKFNHPSPNQYKIEMNWANKSSKGKQRSCERVTFTNGCQYESLKTLGPGAYQISTSILKKGVKKYVYNPHKPRINVQRKSPSVSSYSPCPLQFSTFMRTSFVGRSKQIKIQIDKRKQKENQLPGPGFYQMINTWKGKDKLKKGQTSYMSKITKLNPQKSIYHQRKQTTIY